MNQRGQLELGVGGLIALLILIAISALVLYEVTSATDAENPSVTSTLTADNTASTSTTLTVSDSVSSASITTTLASDNLGLGAGTTTIAVQLNGENIVVATDDNISAVENTIDVDDITIGTNTVTIINDNGDTYLTGSVVLAVNTFFGEAVENVEDKGSTVLDLLTILAIVIVAALIIGVVMRAIGGAAGGVGSPGL